MTVSTLISARDTLSADSSSAISRCSCGIRLDLLATRQHRRGQRACPASLLLIPHHSQPGARHLCIHFPAQIPSDHGGGASAARRDLQRLLAERLPHDDKRATVVAASVLFCACPRCIFRTRLRPSPNTRNGRRPLILVDPPVTPSRQRLLVTSLLFFDKDVAHLTQTFR